MKNLRKRIFEIIQIGSKEDAASRIFDVFIVAVIVVNICTSIAETFDELSCYSQVFYVIEVVTVIVFTIEYILRLWTCNYLYPDRSYGKSILTFIFSFYGIIDLLSFFPFYLPFVIPSGVVAFRIFRVMRILRLFKINAQYDAFNVITDVIKEKRNQILSSVFIIVVLLLASSLCMYSLEHDAQPDQFKNAFSGIWWSVSTMLTVGYGDIYPITIAGKIMAILISFLGVGLVAIPTGIISAGFVEKYSTVRNEALHGTRNNLGTIVIDITEGHMYEGKKISELDIADGLNVAAISHGGEIMAPYGATKIMAGDRLILTDCMQDWTLDFALQGVDIKNTSEWVGKRVIDLDISRLERITMIRKGEKYIVPDNGYVVKEGDHLVIARRIIHH